MSGGTTEVEKISSDIYLCGWNSRDENRKEGIHGGDTRKKTVMSTSISLLHKT